MTRILTAQDPALAVEAAVRTARNLAATDATGPSLCPTTNTPTILAGADIRVAARHETTSTRVDLKTIKLNGPVRRRLSVSEPATATVTTRGQAIAATETEIERRRRKVTMTATTATGSQAADLATVTTGTGTGSMKGTAKRGHGTATATGNGNGTATGTENIAIATAERQWTPPHWLKPPRRTSTLRLGLGAVYPFEVLAPRAVDLKPKARVVTTSHRALRGARLGPLGEARKPPLARPKAPRRPKTCTHWSERRETGNGCSRKPSEWPGSQAWQA